ncbi:hypothetical protein F4778DRAFT_375445 [Xylariomycetidae sp. FL2044]|nr:hypothetical protein F4778DRAFT_375445 [Xylariomycetidae sp. FL2044]
MLANLLESLSSNAGGPDGISELVVTALGTNGRHYICWKTNAGAYRQQSNGLPQILREWLFPPAGGTRDFATLQVILSGEGEFYASDRNGEIRSGARSEAAAESQRQLRRALTFSDESLSSASKRRLSLREQELAKDTERPRSSTLPTSKSDHSRNSPPRSLLRPEAAGHVRSPSADKLRRLSIVPIAAHQFRRKLGNRPGSFGSGNGNGEELDVLKEHPSPRVAVPRPLSLLSGPRSSTSSPSCDCGCHSHHNRRASIIAATTPKSRPMLRAGYADASIQTDPEPECDPIPDLLPRRINRHDRQDSFASTASYDSEMYPRSHRSSVDTTITRPESCYAEEPDWKFQAVNPIMMGRMQDYFRSGTYTLGAALTPAGMG